MTTQMILMVAILLAVTYMFFSPRFPNAVVATIGAVAVGLIGTVPFKSVFTYYAGTSIVLMVGMMIVGGGMFHTGFAGWMGNSIVKLTGKGERSLQIIAILAGGIMSSVCSGSASLMILYPILSSICLASDISISRVLLPLFSGIGFGSFMTLAGSGMCSTTAAILVESGYQSWNFFDPTTVGLPKAIIYFVLLLLFMNKLLPDTFVKPDAVEAAKASDLPDKLTGKMIVSGVILVATVVGMVVNSPACPMYICAAIGGLASVLTGCLNQKQMFANINWNTVFMIGGMTAVAKGVEASGLGDVIADSILGLVGTSTSPFIIMMVLFLVTGFITQFMSNNAAVALMTPIGIAIAQSIGIEPYGFVMACLFGSGIGCLTPMATPILSFVMDGGHYTPKDIFKWGLLECLCTAIAVAICVPLLWM